MKFGKGPNEESSFNNKEPGMLLTLSPVIAVVFISLACGSMVGAYFLGFRAGHTSGLELALANNVSQVVRSPVAKIAADAVHNSNDSSDVYAKLKEPLVAREEDHGKQQDVSKEVKEFLQPTPTLSSKVIAQKADASTKAEQESVQVAALQEKKQADTVAIERALNDAKQKEEISLPAKTELDQKSVRIIGNSNATTEAIAKNTEPSIDANLASKANTKVAANLEKTVLPNQKKVESIDKQAVEDDSQSAETTNNKKVALDKTKEKVPPVANAKTDAAKAADKATAKLKDSKVKEPATKAASVADTPALPAGWYSQVAAPKSLAEAQSIAGRLKSMGFKSRIETAEVRDQKYYRVVVGPEVSRLSADQVLARLRNQKAVKTEPFIRMVR